MGYSYMIAYDIEDTGTITEPVILAEAKTYLRVSGSSEDALITELITSARQSIEKASMLCIVPKAITLWISNEGGSFQFPFGPLTTLTSITNNETGEVLTTDSYTLIGGQYPVLKFPELPNLKIVYTASFATVPKALKDAILDQVNYMYENRGANIDLLGFAPKVANVVLQWTRQSPIL